MAGKGKRTTVADLVAAAKLGTIDPSTAVLTDAEAAELTAEAARTAAELTAAATAELPSTEHACGIPGCRHGSAHPAVSQPDRQVKLQCPSCGAVARMTNSAIARTQGKGITCGGDGATFAVAARRTYSRKAA